MFSLKKFQFITKTGNFIKRKIINQIVKPENCAYCGDLTDLPFQCNYCKDPFCSEHRLPEEHRCVKLSQIRANTDMPVGVGFGIRDAESAALISEFADAVVVGSALVNRIAALVDHPEQIPIEAPKVIADMRAAMDQV